MRSLVTAVHESFRFIGQHGLFKSLARKDAPWLIQFGKYGVCGVIAVVAHNAVVVWLSYNVIPAVESLIDDDRQRAINQTINNLIAFPISNIVAYTTNALWVFTGGRHHRVKEFLYFTLISLVSFVAGLVGGPYLVELFGVPFWVSQGGFILTAAVVNFICRKFIVFKG